jgi:hypothetical protein
MINAVQCQKIGQSFLTLLRGGSKDSGAWMRTLGLSGLGPWGQSSGNHALVMGTRGTRKPKLKAGDV